MSAGDQRAFSINKIVRLDVYHFMMDCLRNWRKQSSLSPPSYQFIYYSFDEKTRYTSEVPHHHSKFLMGSSKTFQFSHCPYTAESVLSLMWCPKCKHAAVSVYTRVSLYWDRKKDTCVWAWFWRGILNLYFKRLYIIFTNRQAWDMDGSMALLGIKKSRLVWILNIMIQTIKIFQNMIYYTFL